MSTIVCQGLQSCLEPRLVGPRLGRPKLAPPESNSPNDKEINKNDEIGESSGGWSFIQALTNTTQNQKEVIDTEKVYVHPLVKRSSSTLCKKSLEMCTESLGSETGSDISESSDDFSLSSMKSERAHTMEKTKSRESGKKLTRSVSFPPPLTSISGLNGVRVRPHREGGRLVIKAVTIAPSNTCFRAERTSGRLRLSLLKEEQVLEGGEIDEGVVEEHDDDNDDDDDGVDDDDDGEWVGDMGGTSENVGCEIDNIGEQFGCCRPSRCKEGGGRGTKGMASWEPFWVATS